MSKILEEPEKLDNFETATELERLENAQEFNDYRLQELKPYNKLTVDGRKRLTKIKNQHAILSAQIKTLKT